MGPSKFAIVETSSNMTRPTMVQQYSFYSVSSISSTYYSTYVMTGNLTYPRPCAQESIIIPKTQYTLGKEPIKYDLGKYNSELLNIDQTAKYIFLNGTLVPSSFGVLYKDQKYLTI